MFLTTDFALAGLMAVTVILGALYAAVAIMKSDEARLEGYEPQPLELCYFRYRMDGLGWASWRLATFEERLGGAVRVGFVRGGRRVADIFSVDACQFMPYREGDR